MENIDEIQKEEKGIELELLEANKERKKENTAVMERGVQEVEEDFIAKCMAAFNLSREEVLGIINERDNSEIMRNQIENNQEIGG